MSQLDWIPQRIQTTILTVAYALFIFIVGRILIKYMIKFMIKWMQYKQLDEGVYTFVTSILRIFLTVLLFMSCAVTLKIDISPILTALGAVGLAISLALKDSLSNLAGGLFIILSKPFIHGDYVGMCGTEGSVKEIGLLHTIIMTSDNKKIFIPNGDIAKAVIVNYSAEEYRRMDLTFSIAYGKDWHLALKLIKNCASERADLKEATEPFVGVKDSSEKSVTILCRIWVRADNYSTCQFELNEQIRTLLDHEELSRPYEEQISLHSSDKLQLQQS